MCVNCPADSVLVDFQTTAEYKSYWEAVAWLVGIIVVARGLMVFFLYV